jgi:hypothetical protein
MMVYLFWTKISGAEYLRDRGGAYKICQEPGSLDSNDVNDLMPSVLIVHMNF